MSILLPASGILAASRRRTTAGTPTVLGNNVKGTFLRGTGAGRMEVSKYTLASAGTLTELHGWFTGGTGSPDIRLVIYDDDGAGALPGARLAYTASLTVLTPDTELTESGLALALAAGDYWIGWISSVATGSAYESGSGTSYRIASGATFTPPPNPFGTTGVSSVVKLSCWGIVLV